MKWKRTWPMTLTGWVLLLIRWFTHPTQLEGVVMLTGAIVLFAIALCVGEGSTE